MRIGVELVRTLYLSRDYDAAIEQCRDLLFLEPRFWPAHRILGLVCLHLGLWEEAITEVENACIYSDRHPAAVCALGCMSAALGRREQAEVALRELDPQNADDYMSWYWHAAIHAWHGEPVAAFESLRAACTQRDRCCCSSESIRSLTRFGRILVLRHCFSDWVSMTSRRAGGRSYLLCCGGSALHRSFRDGGRQCFGNVLNGQRP
jgi:tetratricopeptide (TPR) repeat protein